VPRVEQARIAFQADGVLGLTPQLPHALGALVTDAAGKALGLLSHHETGAPSGDVLRPDLLALANAGYVIPAAGFRALLEAPPKAVGLRVDARRRARAWLGFKPQVLTLELAESLGLDVDSGVRIETLYEGPAKAAGLQVGDIFLKLDGEPLDLDPGESFRDIVEDYPVGATVSVLVRRKGKITTFELELARGPVRAEDADRAVISEVGLTLRALTFFDRIDAGLAAKTPGALVVELAADGAASRAGLRVGDTLIKVEGEPLQGLADLRRRLVESGAHALTVRRNGKELTLRVRR
jgi:S1-C subfamily serine protease